MKKIMFVVHSDIDENNMYEEFEDGIEALEYARRNIDDQTFVDKITIEDDEVINEENIWTYTDASEEDEEIDYKQAFNSLVDDMIEANGALYVIKDLFISGFSRAQLLGLNFRREDVDKVIDEILIG